MNFPKLKTGAISQYPSTRRVEYRTEVLRFLDGTEQRYRLRGKPSKRWLLNFRAIEDEEVRRMTEFFEAQRGGYGSFAFEDPWESEIYDDCSLAREEMQTILEAEGRHQTQVELKENTD